MRRGVRSERNRLEETRPFLLKAPATLTQRQPRSNAASTCSQLQAVVCYSFPFLCAELCIIPTTASQLRITSQLELTWFLYPYTQGSDRKVKQWSKRCFHLCSCRTLGANFAITELQFLNPFRLCDTRRRQLFPLWLLKYILLGCVQQNMNLPTCCCCCCFCYIIYDNI